MTRPRLEDVVLNDLAALSNQDIESCAKNRLDKSDSSFLRLLEALFASVNATYSLASFNVVSCNDELALVDVTYETDVLSSSGQIDRKSRSTGQLILKKTFDGWKIIEDTDSNTLQLLPYIKNTLSYVMWYEDCKKAKDKNWKITPDSRALKRIMLPEGDRLTSMALKEADSARYGYLRYRGYTREQIALMILEKYYKPAVTQVTGNNDVNQYTNVTDDQWDKWKYLQAQRILSYQNADPKCWLLARVKRNKKLLSPNINNGMMIGGTLITAKYLASIKRNINSRLTTKLYRDLFFAGQIIGNCGERTAELAREGRGMDGVRGMSLRGSLRSQARSAPWNARLRSTLFGNREARQAELGLRQCAAFARARGGKASTLRRGRWRSSESSLRSTDD